MFKNIHHPFARNFPVKGYTSREVLVIIAILAMALLLVFAAIGYNNNSNSRVNDAYRVALGYHERGKQI